MKRILYFCQRPTYHPGWHTFDRLQGLLAKTIREFYNKSFDVNDIRTGIIAAVSIKIQEPVFESQTKTKLGSKDMSPESGISVRNFVMDFIKERLDNFLHKNLETADMLNKKILESEKERKAISGIQS